MVNETYRICNTKIIYQKNNNHSKGNISKHIFIEYASTTTKNYFIDINYSIFIFPINIEII